MSGRTTTTHCLPLLFLLFWSLLPVQNACANQQRDHLGHLVVLSHPPRRIVSLAPSITEILFALDQQHRLVGATRFSDYPSDAMKLPRVGSYVHLDVEAIAALAPDLCIAVKDGNPLSSIRRIEEMGIPVYATEPKDLEGVLNTVTELGHLLGIEDLASQKVAALQQRIQQVQSRVALCRHRPSVFFQIGVSPIVSAGGGTVIDDLISAAGGRNIAAGLPAYPRFSEEMVLALAPEVIILTSMERDSSWSAMQTRWQRWPQLPAAAEGRIYLVDSNLFDRPSPRLIDGLEILAGLLHPEGL